MREEHLAKEADALLTNDVLRHALAELRSDTLEDLALVDASDTLMVVRGQQTVRVIDGLVSRLTEYVMNMPETS
jgi:hypothetical protein